MAPETEWPQRYTAVHLDEQRETLLGTVSIDASGMITVQSETTNSEQGDGTESRLARIARIMNATGVMHVDTVPPDDAPDFTLTSIILRRGNPNFIPALIDYLRSYYSVELRPQ